MHVMARIAVVGLLLLPSAALAQLGSPRDVPTRGAGRAGPSPGMKRNDYVKIEQARAEKLAGRRFDQIDSAHKGVVGRDAYITYYEARSKRLAEARFDRIDTDHNGVLEESEIAAWRTAHRRMPRASRAEEP